LYLTRPKFRMFRQGRVRRAATRGCPYRSAVNENC
jgi:hypothetical protein